VRKRAEIAYEALLGKQTHPKDGGREAARPVRERGRVGAHHGGALSALGTTKKEVKID